MKNHTFLPNNDLKNLRYLKETNKNLEKLNKKILFEIEILKEAVDGIQGIQLKGISYD